jgi:adenylate cyclase
MEIPSAYIPMDRRWAIADGATLPDQTHGAALFADISGFTPLTEVLLNEYGPKRGAEELTRQLNLIYDALVTEVHRYGGSVLGFSGDAITCWLDKDDGVRATVCGLAMQQAMSQFKAIQTPSGTTIPLAMKVGVAVGGVRRFQVGDPNIQYIDALVGETLDRMAEAEHHANKGEVVVTPKVFARVKSQVEVSDLRHDPATGEPFAVVARFLDDDKLAELVSPWSPIAPEKLSSELTRSWVLPPVYASLQAGKGDFLAELRPAVSLFLSFSGIDFDQDIDPGEKLDAYVRWVQNMLVRYEGYLLQLTIGDKGCYLYSAFGAPVAHEDDAVRAVSAALELVKLPADLSFITDVKIGVSQGYLRTGAYGGTARRTYGALGDEVNMSARLMQAAEPGQILVKDTVWQATADSFVGEELPPFKVKGKKDPVTAYSITGVRAELDIHLQAPTFSLPMVGREKELSLVKEKLTATVAGHGQIVAIIAEAGMGKSRLVAEVIGLATRQHMLGYGGECQSFGTNISYLVWQSVWRNFFGLDPTWPLQDQLIVLETQLEMIDPALLPRLPLLGAVLNLPIPDNDLTHSFDAKLRKTSLESLLVDCLRARVQDAPVLIVLEDTHWIDPVSHDLLEVIGRAIVDLPVLVVLAYRPPRGDRLQALRVEQLPHFSKIELSDFTAAEAGRLINLKLEQFFGAETDVPTQFVERITGRAQGNPFYIEELLNYLHDQQFNLNDSSKLDQLDLPDSLHTLILARIDRLSEHQKSTIKVASVIGRLFEAGWLWGMYPDLGQPDQVRSDLSVLNELELTPLDKPDPELTYLFKHVVTQEVAYQSLPYAMRAILHDQFGQFIERTYADDLEQYVDLLAYHYDRSENQPKKREYLRRAGELAQAEYANEAALDFFERLLPLLPAEERISVLAKCGEVLTLSGEYEDALTYYAASRYVTIASSSGDEQKPFLAELCRKTAEVYEKRSEYETAFEWLNTGLAYLQAGAPGIEMARLYNQGAMVYRRQGKYDESISWCHKSIAVASQINSRDGQHALARAYSYLGAATARHGNLNEAVDNCLHSIEIYQQLDDKVGLSDAYNNLFIVYDDLGYWKRAGEALTQSLVLKQEIGDIFGQGMMANNLAYIHLNRGEWDRAASLFKQSYAVWQQLGSAWGEAVVLSNLAQVYIDQENPDEARDALSHSETIFAEIGSEEFLPELERRWGEYFLRRGDLEQALTHTRQSIGMAVSQEVRLEEGMSYRVLGQVYMALGDNGQAETALRESLDILTDLNSEFEVAKTILPLVSLGLNGGTAIDRTQLTQAIETFKRLDADADLTRARVLEARLDQA